MFQQEASLVAAISIVYTTALSCVEITDGRLIIADCCINKQWHIEGLPGKNRCSPSL
jgi:phosphotransacetylase